MKTFIISINRESSLIFIRIQMYVHKAYGNNPVDIDSQLLKRNAPIFDQGRICSIKDTIWI